MLQQSPNWAKRFRMSRFVQLRKMSFANARSDDFPQLQGEVGVCQILLRDGQFSLASVNRTDSAFGAFWAHPAMYLPGGDTGCWLASDVVAWREN